ncbi:MAG: putative Ig domain-containing protein, partial [Bacteroidales bacterium]|nr:putative Ig domain-containing protein [Bacteroidales bacterium]
ETDASGTSVWIAALSRTTNSSMPYYFNSQAAARSFINLNWNRIGNTYQGAGRGYNNIVFGSPDVYDRDNSYLGSATTSEICDGENAHNLSGVGADYAWTNNSDYSTIGYVYYASSIASPATIYNNGVAQVSNMFYVVPSDLSNRTNIYQPFNSFSNFIGCPLNGTWTLSVCDSWNLDNGYVFNWELAMDESLIPNNWDYTISLEGISTDCGSIATVSGNDIIVEPIVGTTGDFNCNIHLADNLGCETIIPITYTVISAETTLVSGSTDQTVCEYVPIQDIVYSIGGSAFGAMIMGLPTGVTMSVSGNTITISGTPTRPGVYNYTLTTTGNASCNQEAVTGRIVVTAGDIVPTFDAVGPYCEGTTIDDLPTTSTNGITGTWSPAITQYTNTYTFTPDPGQCATITTMLITVNELPTLTFTSGQESICKGVALTDNIIFTYGGGANGADVSGLPAGLSYYDDAANHQIVISGTPTVAGTFTFVVTTTGAVAPCTNVSVPQNIVVKASPSLVLTSGLATQTICNGADITPLVYTYGGSALGASVVNLPTGLTTTLDEDAQTLTVSGSLTSVQNLTITTTGVPAPCADATLDAAVFISEPATIELTSGLQNLTMCNASTDVDQVVYTFGGTATGVELASLQAQLPEGFTASVSGSTVTISGGPTGPIGNYPYTITTTGAQAPCENATISGSIRVVTNTSLVLTSEASSISQYICLPGDIEDITMVYGSGATGINESDVRASLPAGLSLTVDPATSTAIISGTPTQAGTFNIHVSTTGVISPCKDATLDLTIITTPEPNLTVSGSVNQQLCYGVPIQNMVFTYSGAADGININGSLPNGLISVQNPAAHTLTISGTPTTAGDYNFVVTTVSTSNPCEDKEIEVSISVDDDIVFTIGASATQICTGSSITMYPVPATFPSYQWSCRTSSDANLSTGMPLNTSTASLTVDPTVNVGSSNVQYALLVTDARGCTAEVLQTINVSQTITADVSVIDNTRCMPPFNSSISVSNFAGGYPGSQYTVLISGYSPITTSGAPVVVNNVPEGTYTISVTNSTISGGCSFEQTVVVEDASEAPT